ncbi:helix-turn-helix domain-containing protein [Streptomyces mirabilis]
MLRHAIAPSARYTKASNDVIRHPRLNSDAKLLLLYVQSLPDNATFRPLSELAQKMGIKGRAYQKAKQQLVENGYVHEWRSQSDGGRWITEQLVANTSLTPDQACCLREGTPPLPLPAPRSPSTHSPTVGAPAPRTAGGYEPVEDHSDKTTPHPPSKPSELPEPSEAPALSAPSTLSDRKRPASTADAAQLARAERVLLSLRHARRELHLGVREARSLAVEAVKWLERGLSESDLRHALLAERPQDGVRSAVGFLRYRLVHKLPEPPVRHRPHERPPLPELVECTGPGDPHTFRPLFDETECPSCRIAAAAEHEPEPEPISWRERVARINGTPAAARVET